MPRDLKLNSLSRFSKSSPRLILEEYSHCEVPAGCGGVVLRWRKPDEPLTMWVDQNASSKRDSFALDGKVFLTIHRLNISWGYHVFAMSFEDVNLSNGLLLFSASVDEQFMRILQPEGEPKILSKPDGKWKYTLNTPADNWQSLDFDDSDWSPMVAKRLSNKPFHGHDMSKFHQRTRDLGAEDLGVAEDSGVSHVWVRRAFYLQPRKANEE